MNTSKQTHAISKAVYVQDGKVLPENEGKLIYNYSLGTTDYLGAESTDLSGIDAEASLTNGAHIIYMDTNNSMNDFHQRAVASLKR